jgi:rRNA maturation protein Nop10
MKARVSVMFNSRDRPWPVVRRILEDAGQLDLARRGPNPYANNYNATFAADTPELARLRTALTEEGLTWLERREHLYTEAELWAAPLLELIVRVAEKGRGGPTYGTQYDLSQACPQCGTGAVQISPLVLAPVEIPKTGAIFQTFHSEMLVAPMLAQALKEAGVTGLTLGEVRSKAGRPLPWVQLLSTTELPPMAPQTRGIIRGTGPDSPCPGCGRDGYFHTTKWPSEIAYATSQVTPDPLPDVVHTYERFGRSWLREPFEQSRFAQPLLLVKPKVYDIFKRQKVRRVEFHPVRLVDS